MVDIKRIYIMFFATIFAIFVKLLVDNFLPLTSIPNIIGFAVSPIAGLLLAQLMIEKFDGKEIGLFALFMFLSNVILQLFPNIREFNLFNLTTGTTIGLTVTIVAYLVTIPVSVLLSDLITDKGIKIFKGIKVFGGKK